jgi:AcrR family transcriptional regulator
MAEARRSGRWRTGEQSRQRILEAARAGFMRDGYDGATIRKIAADAGVDIAMVYYFFKNKEGLFNAAVLTGPQHPLQQLDGLLDEGTDDIGARLVRRFVEGWDQGGGFEPLITLWRSAGVHMQARELLHHALAGPMAERIATEFGVADAELRAELVASHLMGVAFARYMLKIEPLASTPVDELVVLIGPTLQRYLTGG